MNEPAPQETTKRVPSGVLLAIMGALLFALLPMPYGYYQLLRVVTCVISIWGAVAAYNRKDQTSLVIWAILALAYNPLVPLTLGRGLWSFVNIVSVVFIAWEASRTAKNP